LAVGEERWRWAPTAPLSSRAWPKPPSLQAASW
jgi:hypothetical protein